MHSNPKDAMNCDGGSPFSQRRPSILYSSAVTTPAFWSTPLLDRRLVCTPTQQEDPDDVCPTLIFPSQSVRGGLPSLLSGVAHNEVSRVDCNMT